jgi:asparagine synthase (glutamine-hydrolysing)
VDFVAQDRDLYFPQEMLRKCDRMTMAYSVEGRVPFAAPAVLSHAEKLSFAHMVAPDGMLKHVLRKAFSDILSEDVLSRPKHGFNVPIDHWLKYDWADLVENTFRQDSALNREGLLAAGAQQAAQALLHDKKRLNGHTIFSMIMLNKWLETNAH